MSFEEIKQDADRFLSEKIIRESEGFTPQQLEHTVESEVMSVTDVAFADNRNRTQGMRDHIIKRHRDDLVEWKHKYDIFIHQLDELKQETTASKATAELNALRKKRDDKKKDCEEQVTRGDAYRNAKKDKNETYERYERMRRENGGKPPRSGSLPLYILSIIGIGSVEALINYSTFDSKFGAPGLAIGATAFVAIAFAFASHFHGAFLKQRLALLGPELEKRVRNNSLIWQLVVTSIFLFAFAAVAIVRYQVVADEMSFSQIIGGGGLPGIELDSQPSILWLLFPTLLMNLGVWGVGIFISYIVHDAVPGYQEAKKSSDKASKFFGEKEDALNQELDRIDKEFSKNTEELSRRVDEEAKINTRAEQLRERLVKEYNSVLGATEIRLNEGLSQYRTMFVTIAKQKKQNIKVGAKLLSLDQYLDTSIDFTREELKRVFEG